MQAHDRPTVPNSEQGSSPLSVVKQLKCTPLVIVDSAVLWQLLNNTWHESFCHKIWATPLICLRNANERRECDLHILLTAQKFYWIIHRTFCFSLTSVCSSSSVLDNKDRFSSVTSWTVRSYLDALPCYDVVNECTKRSNTFTFTFSSSEVVCRNSLFIRSISSSSRCVS
jgi:hypothetical protein